MTRHLALSAGLGGTPSEWSSGRFKMVVHRREERRGRSGTPLLSLSSEGHLYPRVKETDRQQAAEDNLERCLIVRPDDLVINPMWLTGGSIAVSSLAGAVSPDYRVFRPGPDINPRFLHHVLRSQALMNQYRLFVRADTTFDRRIQQGDLDEMELPLPPLPEQRQIANFLDDQTTRIDETLAARRRQISAIAESRLHVLGAAAASLWPAAVQRPVPWFPVHREGWRVSRMSWIADCLDSQRIPLSAEVRGGRQGPYPYYGASTIVDHIDDYLFDEPLVLVGEDGGALSNPRFDVVQEVVGRVWVNNHAHVLRAKDVGAPFLAAMLRAVDRELLISGATRPKITQEDLMAIRIPVPPPVDRQRMMAVCGSMARSWDEGKRSLVRSVELLQEFKRSLISAAVSGDFDVSAASGRGVPV